MENREIDPNHSNPQTEHPLKSDEQPETKNNFELVREIMMITLPTYLFYATLNTQVLLNIRKANLMFNNELEKSNAIGFSSIFCNMFGFSILIGMVSGFEILGPNALGRKDSYLMGIYLQRSKIIGLFCVLCSITLIYFFGVPVMMFMASENVDEDTLRSFIVPYSLCLIPEVQNRANYNYLNVVEKSYISIITSLIATSTHFFVLEFFVDYLNCGIAGIAYSMIFTISFNGLLTTLYIEIVRPIPESVFCYNADSFKDLWNYALFSAPIMVLMCGEWWAWEVLCIITARIGEVDYNTHIGISSLFYYTLALGIGLSTSVTVKASDFIAAGQIKEVKETLFIAFIVLVIFMIIAEVSIFALSGFLVKFLTDIVTVQDNLLKMFPIMLIQQVFDCAQYILNGFMKAMGKQCQATTIVILTCYTFQTGLIYLIGIKLEYGLIGIYTSLAASTLLLGLEYIVCICFFDYEQIHKETVERITEAQNVLEREEKLVEDTA